MEVVKVTLAKKWHECKAGSKISVDGDRAKWLEEHGYFKLKPKPKEEGRSK